jgi:preprotein translocase subunit SecE
LVEQRIPNPQVVGSSPSAPAGHRNAARERSITMAVQKDLKPERAPEAGDSPGPQGDARPAPLDVGGQPESPAGTGEAPEEHYDVAPVGAASPSQLGTRRFVYAAYFAGAIAIAFLASKVIDLAWIKAQAYKPAIGEPRDEIVMPVAGLMGGAAAVYYWNRTRARQLAEEVAAEMSKVTWPTRTEVTNGTIVVIVTTVLSTVFFALMDKFWGFITNLVYGGS